jgi:hypothetical protein
MLAGAQMAGERLGGPPGTEEIGVQRSLDAGEVNGQRAGVGVVVDGRVVDEDVEAIESVSERSYAVGVGDIQARRPHITSATQLLSSGLGALDGSGRAPHDDPGLRELATDLDPEPASATGHERDAPAVGRHASPRPAARAAGCRLPAHHSN